ncbi:MAG: hypothetical protein IKL16_00165 [Clostridia bacterium]|nr:hypothetical protein [Clostridia bacterium]
MIRKFEYDRAVLLSDFLAKTKNIIEKKPQISDVHFIPEINGYKINFNDKSNAVEISLCFEKIFLDKLKIKVFEGENLKVSYVSNSKEKNTEILSDIF